MIKIQKIVHVNGNNDTDSGAISITKVCEVLMLVSNSLRNSGDSNCYHAE